MERTVSGAKRTTGRRSGLSRHKWAWFMALAVLLTSGCYKATFYQDPQAAHGIEHEQWSDFYLFGLVGTEEIDTREYCRNNGVAAVQTAASFGSTAVSVLTIGVYTPRELTVTCAGAPRGDK